ncbi:hypothetical protein EVAR_73098_1, partial [Eumeta japonica]
NNGRQVGKGLWKRSKRDLTQHGAEAPGAAPALLLAWRTVDELCTRMWAVPVLEPAHSRTNYKSSRRVTSVHLLP